AAARGGEELFPGELRVLGPPCGAGVSRAADAHPRSPAGSRHGPHRGDPPGSRGGRSGQFRISGEPARLVALSPGKYPNPGAAEIRPPTLSHRGVVRHGGVVEQAVAPRGQSPNRRIGRRATRPETCPRPALAAVLTASLAARRAGRVRDTAEHAVA